jgi:hypothetical protein
MLDASPRPLFESGVTYDAERAALIIATPESLLSISSL